MLKSQLALKYAQAIFELAQEKGMLDEVEKQLTLVESTISSHNDLATLFYHPRVPAEAKKDTIRKVFGSELTEYVRNFLLLLVDKRRETALRAIVHEFIQLANQARNIVEAQVTTARPLSPEAQQALAAKLSAVTGRNVALKTAVDDSILGGVVVKIGDKLIDGSVARQLNSLKAALLSTELTKIGVTD
ncbi:ATP synthase F1, delta subunit [Thermosinus carboxydivorans Nor1]|uniref:ATP synthase subunit delta n=1 Tax=Thermosinus carboxydivorans Nor1 TaxID=401526 RepID=A1HRD1_9FIRM|nr:ATP synthase F1 subunit delta [Thermosinus carboxydivorans]EAX47446.1 ATP synthase F1, delta subunit [Thermosinus carboxydivorans Nor1]